MSRRAFIFGVGIAFGLFAGLSGQAQTAGPNSVLKTTKVDGAGSLDYVYADNAGRRLYVPRGGAGQGMAGRISVFNLDTLEPVGEVPNASARGAAVDPVSHHGFASSKPVVMWDTNTLATIKTIDVQGGPDGILFDPFNARIWILSHSAPNVTLINAADGTIAGTIELGGAPEQAQSDGKGTVYIDLEDKNSIAVVDAKAMKLTNTYDISAKCGAPGGLGLDNKNHILFATCHSAGSEGAQGAASMTILSTDGKILTSLPIGTGTDGGGFNPNTMEAFSSNGSGTLSIIKETSPTTFVVEQELKTMTGAKTMTIDTKSNHVLLIAPEYGPAPAPATPPANPPAGGRAGRGNRGPMLDFQILVAGK